MVTAGEYYKDLVKNVTAKDMPYRYIDIPYSEAQFKRLRKKFFVNLHNIKNEREYHERMYGEWEKRKH